MVGGGGKYLLTVAGVMLILYVFIGDYVVGGLVEIVPLILPSVG